MRKAHWKNIGLSVAIACVMSLGLMSAGTVFAGAKVDVCHLPPGNPENFHTITISENALSAHLGHGDFEGACNANCASLCDDGNACTIDDTGDCAEVGCPLAPEPVDCNDSDPTTVDTCDPSIGCINTPTVVCPCEGLTVGAITFDDSFETNACMFIGIGTRIDESPASFSHRLYVYGPSTIEGNADLCGIQDGPLTQFIGISLDEWVACDELQRQIAANDGVTCP